MLGKAQVPVQTCTCGEHVTISFSGSYVLGRGDGNLHVERRSGRTFYEAAVEANQRGCDAVLWHRRRWHASRPAR